MSGLSRDFACFALVGQGRLIDDCYMTFFNHRATPCGGITLGAVCLEKDGFAFRLSRLPASVERIVITATIDGGAMSQLASGTLRLVGEDGEFARFKVSGEDFAAEQAVMLGETYRKDNQWRFMAVAQGFDGGLPALVRYFGATVAETAAVPVQPVAAPVPAALSINLEKRVEQVAPQLVNLVKSAGVSLAKVGLETHCAKVCLVLDISGSMAGLYRKGLVQRFAERILALGCRFDDDGGIDVFLFGSKVHQSAPMGLGIWSGYVGQVIERHPLEGGTRYGAAMEAVRRFYFPNAANPERTTLCKSALPVYVMFVTDGSTHDEAVTERQLRLAVASRSSGNSWGSVKAGKAREVSCPACSTRTSPSLKAGPDRWPPGGQRKLLFGRQPQRAR